jgi:hypothetical protein
MWRSADRYYGGGRGGYISSGGSHTGRDGGGDRYHGGGRGGYTTGATPTTTEETTPNPASATHAEGKRTT